MGTVIIQEHTTKNPITLIGEQAGICWGADTSNAEKNYKRGLECLSNNHGRTLEFPDVYMILDGYSARVIREWYTHIGGAPTRLQASTRYIDYSKGEGFDFIHPHWDSGMLLEYQAQMHEVNKVIQKLEEQGAKREDTALLLPLGMTTKVACKHNSRNLIDMSHQRMCTRAYWEYRQLFNDLCNALIAYSEEWAYLVKHYFKPKCEVCGFCTEKYTCGRMPSKEELQAAMMIASKWVPEGSAKQIIDRFRKIL